MHMPATNHHHHPIVVVVVTVPASCAQYEGVSRFTTSLRRRHRDRVVRRGLGMIIESDFYSTPAGRQHFADQLTSIKYCVTETINFDVLFAYLSCTNYDFAYDLSKNLRPRRNVRMAMANEIATYAIAQKDQMGMDKAVEEAKYRMSRYGSKPNMLILPPQMLLYLALAPEEKLTYKEAGPAGAATFEAGVEGYKARAFRGCGVFTSEPFEVSDDNDSVQMLTRNVQVGEFYVMEPPQTKPGKQNQIGSCDILIYNEEKDMLARIKWEDAVKATLAERIDDTTVMTGGMTLSEWKNQAKFWSDFNTDETVDFNEDYRNVRIILARPFIEHMMHSAILTVAGRETGATLYGPSDMQLSANTQVKTIEG
jgi:hypothetical protein